MWKKLENFAGSKGDSAENEAIGSSSLPEGAESADDPWLIGRDEHEQPEVEATVIEEKQGGARPKTEQTPLLSLGAYTEAVNKFTKSASAFIEHLPLLVDAKQAYDEATKASAELRRVLDAGDENLRALMSHLEQMANVHLVSTGKSDLEKRNREPSKLGPVRVGEEEKGAIKRFP